MMISMASSTETNNQQHRAARLRAERVCQHLTTVSTAATHQTAATSPTSASSAAPTSASSSSSSSSLPSLSSLSSPAASSTQSSSSSSHPHPQSSSSPSRHWNGWGYQDTEFTLTKLGSISLNGHRYSNSGKNMPHLRSWMEARTGIDVKDESPSQSEPVLPPPVIHTAFLSAVANHCHHIDQSDRDRLFHAHGHTAQEVYMLRFGSFPRVPDAVIYPNTTTQVQQIVLLANEHNVVIIPYGGGTTVSQSLLCPVAEQRMIISLDMHLLCAIKWINRVNMTACIEAGIVGKDLERQLNAMQLTMGHEPDSMEFSTLGGWIATRASGMRKNKYGNIEDIVQQITMVAANGSTIEKSLVVPRISTGPDIHEIILGSEGTLGVITEAVVKLHDKAEVTTYGSIVFPCFEAGVAALQEIQRAHVTPVSIRLVDNGQFQFSQALKVATDDWSSEIIDAMKRWYVTKHLQFDVNRMVACTLVFEGKKREVSEQESQVYSISSKHGGIKGGAENGVRGYFLTYMIAYLRDFGFRYSFIAESFETSCPWANILSLCENTKNIIVTTAHKLGVQKAPFVSCRVTQLYDSGVCVYFYFGFVWTGLSNPVAVFDQIEHIARECILKHGGSLSHHHGVGKLRKEWMQRTIGDSGIELLKVIKKGMDPKNIFASGNLITL